MLFSSMTFIFMFLPIVCTLYYIVGKRFRNDILLWASFLFYAWGEPRYVAVMFLTIFINYFGALLIEKTNWKKSVLCLTILLNLSFLFYFKYTNFFISNINFFLEDPFKLTRILMPIGISFYTFQALSYVIDVYRGKTAAQRNLYDLALYIVLFPQLVAGPIVKYHDIADQITNRDERIDKVYLGVQRFICGLAKKMLIANTMGALADEVFSSRMNEIPVLLAWVGAFAYSFQIYFDFSGYSDMAIGLCLVFGFKIPENFNYPYISKSITEFWRRWHISLSTWFKEYLYFPLGGNRGSKGRTAFNLMLVFFLTGFWHGASWNFIFWGVWHGCFIVFEKLTGINHDGLKRWQRVCQHLYALFVVLIGWVFFRADTMTQGIWYVKKMFGLVPDGYKYFNWVYYVDGQEIVVFLFAAVLSTPVAANFIAAQGKWKTAGVQFTLMLLFLLSWVTIAAGTYNPFIYFRF